MRDPRVVVMWVGVLVDVQRALHVEVRVREERPVRARRDPQLVRVVQFVGQDRDDLGERDRAPLVELDHLLLLLALPRTVLAAPEHQHEAVVALEL